MRSPEPLSDRESAGEAGVSLPLSTAELSVGEESALLVYAANREERVEQLEAENVRLLEKLEQERAGAVPLIAAKDAEIKRLRTALECIIAKFRSVQCQEPTCDGYIGGALDVARAALAKASRAQAELLSSTRPQDITLSEVCHENEDW